MYVGSKKPGNMLVTGKHEKDYLTGHMLRLCATMRCGATLGFIRISLGDDGNKRQSISAASALNIE
jgi:hypothetical protein